MQSHFHDYYAGLDYKMLELPDFTKREFGFLRPDKKEMIRHLAFSDALSLKKYLVALPPSHVYSSTALYERPSEPDMNAKGWIGSEMIFEFDADHMKELRDKPNVKRGVLDNSDWSLVKDRTKHLIYDFLIEDFGLQDKEISINFSGNRGFHVRVRANDYIDLDQDARRRLASYINGADLDVDSVFTRLSARRKVREITFSQPGWMERIRKIMDEKKMSAEDAVKEASLDIDENVLLDLHRLIRHVHTLHAGTGLVVTPISIDGIDSFDPYVHAVVKSDEEVLVKMEHAELFNGLVVGDLIISSDLTGRILRLNRSVAVFLLLKGLAKAIG